MTDLASFTLPDDWKATILTEASRRRSSADETVQQRQHLESRLRRLKDLDAWGDLEQTEYLTQRAAIEQALARLIPAAPSDDWLDALAAYLKSLPAAWADATPEQRNQLANILYCDTPVSDQLTRPRRRHLEIGTFQRGSGGHRGRMTRQGPRQ